METDAPEEAVPPPARPSRRAVVTAAVIGVLFFATAIVVVVQRADRSWEAGELVILSGRDDSAGAQRKELIGKWNELHRGNPARVEEVRSIADAERSEMLARAAGDGGDVDILNLDVAYVPEFAEADLLRPLSEDGVDRDAFLPGPLSTCEYNGRLWALPFNTDAALLYRHLDYAPGVPADWGAMDSAISGQLKGNPEQRAGPTVGLVTQLGNYEALTVNTLEAVWAAGGEVVDDDGDVRIDSPAATQGLRHLVDGLVDGHIDPESPSYTEDASTAAFRDGNAMFLRNWPLAYRALTGSAEDRPAPFRIGVSRLPWASVLGGQNLAIAERSEHPRAARALIDFLTDTNSQRTLFERGGFAATREVVYRDSAVPYAEVLLAAVQHARLRPRSPHYALFSEVLREAVHTMLVSHDRNPPPGLADDLRAALRGQRA
ncbi:extracellular solute-binding protein [Cryptosporangium aurantiacum]|uniref:Carbohydrate ABC transporter substrate-binding protein, CUT1 family n=1 Tax=Cryptosporangium aurantiacum TaxID=134849 RepID=A0A1M7RJ20_9ACTN|nr:extracellular solute-binding protein [Cryptosporangium aurantiacum]SHN46170.1 carbohydrate ABC transporter substrate-binding protein, CUT1 family [Cryptosporangium aurantiacum]